MTRERFHPIVKQVTVMCFLFLFFVIVVVSVGGCDGVDDELRWHVNDVFLYYL